MSGFKDTCVMSVTLLSEAFGRNATEATHRAYQIGLNGLDTQSIGVATKKALVNCKFMPTPAELRELSGELSDKDQSLFSWNVVLEAIRKVGPYGAVDFVADKTINAVVRNMGGWPGFIERLSGVNEEKWARKEFLDTYHVMRRVGVTGDICNSLPGLSEGRVEIRDGIRVSLPPPVFRIGKQCKVIKFLPEESESLKRLHSESKESSLKKLSISGRIDRLKKDTTL